MSVDYWDEISQDLYEKGYMDRYAPPPGTPPGVATGYICCKGGNMKKHRMYSSDPLEELNNLLANTLSGLSDLHVLLKEMESDLEEMQNQLDELYNKEAQ
uniref:Uncharacterized protein n=1 Tax=viral metagenome TaxID=1070528 RepID=A0A6M3JGE2_9ZZZZ